MKAMLNIETRLPRKAKTPNNQRAHFQEGHRSLKIYEEELGY